MTSMLEREIVFLILQFLEEEELKDAFHCLERESGFFFNMRYFEECVTNGEWHEVEKYLAGFTKLDDNQNSVKIFFEIRKQKYLEALDKQDHPKAAEILAEELKVFSTFDEDLFKETAMLLTLGNFRENEKLSNYGDIKSARTILFLELKKLIEANPLFHNKLQFPSSENSRLRKLINQSINWAPYGALSPSPATNPLLGGHGPMPAPSTASSAGRMANPSPVPHQAISAEPIGPIPPCADRTGPVTSISGLNVDNWNLPDMTQRVADELEKSKIWKQTGISEPSKLRSLMLPDNLLPIKVVKMTYTNSGTSLLALGENGAHKLWKWFNRQNIPVKVTSSLLPKLRKPPNGILMTNDLRESNQEDAVPCLALSNNDCYLFSSSGGKTFFYNLIRFQEVQSFTMRSAATSISLHPQDSNIIAVGTEDSLIHIFHGSLDKVKGKLRGHKKRVTGLAFSIVLNVLVSSGADAQLCVWSMDKWMKQAAKFLQIPPVTLPDHLSHTRAHFHQDQIHVLAVHTTQISIHEAPKLECLAQWVPRVSSGLITDAVYSCDSQSVYACLEDGTVNILTATTKSFELRCRVDPSAYLPSNPSLIHPVVVVSHPSEPNQFAVGLTDGRVHVLEPLESEGKWGTSNPVDDAGPSSSSAAGSDQQPR